MNAAKAFDGLKAAGTALVIVGVGPVATAAQQTTTAAPALVFEGVTVIDVEQGQRFPGQRVVVLGNRIQAVGPAGGSGPPTGAQVVDARGKYLIPGLWDMHYHRPQLWSLDFDPTLIAHGVTGIREAGTGFIPTQPFVQKRREVLAGSRVGPPRQILSSLALNEERFRPPRGSSLSLASMAGRLVDSARAAGADMFKLRELSPSSYLILAAELRRVGMPFGGHATKVGGLMASDSGATIIDHANFAAGGVDTLCVGAVATVARCHPVAERFRKNGTWLVPTLVVAVSVAEWGFPSYYEKQIARRPGGGDRAMRIYQSLAAAADAFKAGALLHGNWLREATPAPADTLPGALRVAHGVGLPILAGSDFLLRPMPAVGGMPLHAELAILVAEGLPPLAALQAATLNPAKMLHATDTLGTVAPGKLADLVLLDADPLADITNTTTIRAVVANGRYFDRAALDKLLTEAQAHPSLGKDPNKP